MKSHKSEVAITFMYTNQERVSLLEKTEAKTFRTGKHM